MTDLLLSIGLVALGIGQFGLWVAIYRRGRK